MQYDENAEKYGYEGEMTPMKCDELKAYKGDVYIPVYGSIADAEVYLKKDVDAAIAELKDVIHELQVDLEGAKATAYAESVDAGMRERRLRRALWLTRAGEASKEVNYWTCQDESSYAIVDFNVRHETIVSYKAPHHRPYRWILIWENIERKCRAKAEEYK